MSDNMHTHITELTPVVGAKYAVSIRGEQLYEATVCRAEGCWAILRVEKPMPGKYEAMYNVGDTFEVKIAMYRFEQIANS